MECGDVGRVLDAYVDDELGPAESASTREHFDACTACRQRLADRESLGRLVRQAPYYAAPAGLRARLASSHTPSAWTSHPLVAWAAAVLLVASLAGSVVFIRSSAPARGPIDSMAEAVVDSHVRALMGQHLFDVRSTDQHTVKPWFLGKLDFAPPVDDLAPLGFPLTGGRLDYVAGRAAAALVYARGQHTINLFVWPDDSATLRTPAVRAIRGFHVRHWTRGGMSFWAVSDLNDAELDQFTGALQR
jgi:anti-sigma factor RsiW